METFLHAVASVTIILLLTATGYFCAVKGWMTAQVKTFISRYLMTVGIPVMLIYGMQNNLTRADVLAAPRLLLIPLLVIPSCVVLSLLTGRLMRLPHRQLGVFVMMSAMGNTHLYRPCHVHRAVRRHCNAVCHALLSCQQLLLRSSSASRWYAGRAKPAASPCRWCGNSCARRRSFLSFSVSCWSDWTSISRAL